MTDHSKPTRFGDPVYRPIRVPHRSDEDILAEIDHLKASAQKNPTSWAAASRAAGLEDELKLRELEREQES